MQRSPWRATRAIREESRRRVTKCFRGAELRLLLVVLLHGRRGLVLHLGHPLLEFLDAATERAGQIGETLGPEEDQHDDQDQQQLLISQTEHGGTPFLFLTPPYPTRPPRGFQRRRGSPGARGAPRPAPSPPGCRSTPSRGWGTFG